MENINENKIRKSYTMAMLAIKRHKFDALKEQVEENPDVVNYSNDIYGTLLHYAAHNGETNEIEYLLEHGSDINRIENELSALSQAVRGNKINNVNKLLDSGAVLDVSNSINNPLFFAISKGYIDIARVLIDAGIDLTVVYKTKDNPWWDTLSFAQYYEQDEIVKLIKDKLKIIDESIEEPLIEEDEEEIVYFEDYLEKYLGHISSTFDEIIQVTDIPVTVNIIMPNEKRDYITLVTSGMSAEPMAEVNGEIKYAELIMKLPRDWKVDNEMLEDEKYSWPLRILRKVAYLPHIHKGYYISENVVIPNGDVDGPPYPFTAGTKLSRVMLCKSKDIPDYVIDDKAKIEFFTLIPITENEESLVKSIGSNKVLELLGDNEVVNLWRKNL